MDFVDPIALLGDMTFQWQKPPFCTLADDIENLNPQDTYSNLMDSMLFEDHMELPEIATMVPEPNSTSFPTIATESVVKGSSWSASLWQCRGSTPPPIVSDILQVGGANETIVKFPLVVQEGDIFDGSIVEASEPKSPQLASAPFTPPAVKQKSRRASKKAPKSKAATAPKVTSAVELEDAPEPVEEIRVNITHEEHIIRERHRRNDTSAKYLVLESLLPPAPKRERAVVVEDATLLVRALQQKKAQLLKRRAELKMAETPNQHSQLRRAKEMRPFSQNLHHDQTTGMGACITQQITSAAPTEAAKNINAPKAPDSSLSSNSEGSLDGSAMNAIGVHAGVEDMVVEMVWNRPPPHFESSLLHAVESLGSEVTRCNIVRVTSGVAQCFITFSRPQVSSQLSLEMQSMASEILIRRALRELLARSR